MHPNNDNVVKIRQVQGFVALICIQAMIAYANQRRLQHKKNFRYYLRQHSNSSISRNYSAQLKASKLVLLQTDQKHQSISWFASCSKCTSAKEGFCCHARADMSVNRTLILQFLQIFRTSFWVYDFIVTWSVDQPQLLSSWS